MRAMPPKVAAEVMKDIPAGRLLTTQQVGISFGTFFSFSFFLPSACLPACLFFLPPPKKVCLRNSSISSLHHQQVSAAGIALLAKGRPGTVLVVLANGEWVEPQRVRFMPSSRTCAKALCPCIGM